MKGDGRERDGHERPEPDDRPPHVVSSLTERGRLLSQARAGQGGWLAQVTVA